MVPLPSTEVKPSPDIIWAHLGFGNESSQVHTTLHGIIVKLCFLCYTNNFLTIRFLLCRIGPDFNRWILHSENKNRNMAASSDHFAATSLGVSCKLWPCCMKRGFPSMRQWLTKNMRPSCMTAVAVNLGREPLLGQRVERCGVKWDLNKHDLKYTWKVNSRVLMMML